MVQTVPPRNTTSAVNIMGIAAIFADMLRNRPFGLPTDAKPHPPKNARFTQGRYCKRPRLSVVLLLLSA